MVWYGMVWYGMVWYGMVWYGIVSYGIVSYRMVDGVGSIMGSCQLIVFYTGQHTLERFLKFESSYQFH